MGEDLGWFVVRVADRLPGGGHAHRERQADSETNHLEFLVAEQRATLVLGSERPASATDRHKGVRATS